MRPRRVFDLIEIEDKRQRETLELIASENFVSDNVARATGSILTNKYAEGYPKKRIYGGCKVVDKIEKLAIDNARKLFKVDFANVQPHSGTQANAAVYLALLEKGDKVLSMKMNHGGHITHGHDSSFSGRNYNFVHYGVNEKTEVLDYAEIEKIALEEKPKLIVAGFSSYSREIDFEKFREIADKVGAFLMVDMAHIAGLVAAGLHSDPCIYADVVTSTTHKTLRGPRGGLILTNNEEIASSIDKAVFPGIQGGPLMHVIAAKAVCFMEARGPEFVEYQEQVIRNAKSLSDYFIKMGYHVVSGGTDNHMITVDVNKKWGITGEFAEKLLGSVNINCSKNTVPSDKEPFVASGIRLGSAAMTTRGFRPGNFIQIAILIDSCLANRADEVKVGYVRSEGYNLIKMFTNKK